MVEASTEKLVLALYGIANSRIDPIGSGLINYTWLVTSNDKKYILQRVNRMFNEGIHEDIEHVTAYLVSQGLTLPRLVRTQTGALYSRIDDSIWRLYDYIDGITHDIVQNPEVSRQAGRLLGEFHKLLNTMDYTFKNLRPGVHDTERHLRALEEALVSKRNHPKYHEIKDLGLEIISLSKELPLLPSTTPRKVHGDPKINNFLFDKKTAKGICMLDYDTLSDMQIMLELGDAMRSWCNPYGENDPQSSFSLENFQAGLAGYREGAMGLLTETEWKAILPATLTIYIELSARFCGDALNEDYFAWDNNQYSSHSEHSQIRALSQLNAGKSLLKQYKEAENILNTPC